MMNNFKSAHAWRPPRIGWKGEGIKTENIIRNIKAGQTDNTATGVELAMKIARKYISETGRECRVRRVLDYVDRFDGRDREHWSFDVYEV